MSAESTHAAPTSHVPELARVIEGACHDEVAHRAEIQTHDFGRVTQQRGCFRPALNIPEFGRIVHRSRRDAASLWIERETHNLCCVTAQRIILGMCVCVCVCVYRRAIHGFRNERQSRTHERNREKDARFGIGLEAQCTCGDAEHPKKRLHE